MGRYSKGIVAGFGMVTTALMQYIPMFCDTWWPMVAAIITTGTVIAVPNARQSD